MKDALLFREGLGHNANGRSLVMTPELFELLFNYKFTINYNAQITIRLDVHGTFTLIFQVYY